MIYDLRFTTIVLWIYNYFSHGKTGRDRPLSREKPAQVSRITHHASRITYLALAAFSLILPAFPALAAAQSPIDAEVDFFVVSKNNEGSFTVGDRITLRLQVTHPANSEIDLPLVEEQWGELEVVDQTGQDTVKNIDGTAVTRKDIIVSLFEPGQYQTPSLVVTHHKADNTTEELGSPVIPINIDTVLVEGDEDLRDLKEQFSLPVPPLWPFILAGIALAAAVSGGLFWAGRWAYNRWWVKEPVQLGPQPAIDTRPPEVIAYLELARIEALNLPAQDRLKSHYTLVTDCLRDYIERRYQIPALEQTTDELRDSFRRTPAAPPEDRRDFVGLFNRSDYVKFARLRPTAEEVYGLIPAARTVVDKTTPDPKPEPELKLSAPDTVETPPPETENTK